MRRNVFLPLVFPELSRYCLKVWSILLFSLQFFILLLPTYNFLLWKSYGSYFLNMGAKCFRCKGGLYGRWLLRFKIPLSFYKFNSIYLTVRLASFGLKESSRFDYRPWNFMGRKYCYIIFTILFISCRTNFNWSLHTLVNGYKNIL